MAYFINILYIAVSSLSTQFVVCVILFLLSALAHDVLYYLISYCQHIELKWSLYIGITLNWSEFFCQQSLYYEFLMFSSWSFVKLFCLTIICLESNVSPNLYQKPAATIIEFCLQHLQLCWIMFFDVKLTKNP